MKEPATAGRVTDLVPGSLVIFHWAPNRVWFIVSVAHVRSALKGIEYSRMVAMDQGCLIKRFSSYMKEGVRVLA